MYTYVLNFNQSEDFSDPARGCSVTSYRLSGEVLHRVLHSGRAYMTSHNKHHGGLNVVLGERYKNAHNNSNTNSNMSGTIFSQCHQLPP